MSRQLSVGPILNAIDDLLEQLDEVARQETTKSSEAAGRVTELRQLRSQVEGWCRHPDEGQPPFLHVISN